MPNAAITKIIIADDHQVVVEGLALILKQREELEIIGSANNGLELIELLKSKIPDIVLLDIEMPLMDGLVTCKTIKAEFPSIKVLMLSSFNRGALIEQALKNGADGYVIKNKVSEELIKAIQQIMSGQVYIDQEANANLLKSFNKQKDNAAFLPKLTRREKEVLKLIIQEHNTSEIATALFVSINTVESHRKNLMSKLGAKNMAGLVRIALERGLLES